MSDHKTSKPANNAPLKQGLSAREEFGEELRNPGMNAQARPVSVQTRFRPARPRQTRRQAARANRQAPNGTGPIARKKTILYSLESHVRDGGGHWLCRRSPLIAEVSRAGCPGRFRRCWQACP